MHQNDIDYFHMKRVRAYRKRITSTKCAYVRVFHSSTRRCCRTRQYYMRERATTKLMRGAVLCWWRTMCGKNINFTDGKRACGQTIFFSWVAAAGQRLGKTTKSKYIQKRCVFVLLQQKKKYHIHTHGICAQIKHDINKHRDIL